MGWDISLSASKLGLKRECTRCFFDANVLKIDRPRGIFPSLPGGVDRAMKESMDAYRGSMMPPLDTELTGVLWGRVEQINKLRNWRSGLKANLSIGGKLINLVGALDDVILERDETFSPYDTKTKGDVPKDDGAQYYQEQVDIYALLLRENDMRPSGKGYLCYWYPVMMVGGAIRFEHALYTLTADPERALASITEAVAILSGGQPDHNPTCEYCRFAQARVDAAVRAIAQPAIMHAITAK